MAARPWTRNSHGLVIVWVPERCKYLQEVFGGVDWPDHRQVCRRKPRVGTWHSVNRHQQSNTNPVKISYTVAYVRHAALDSLLRLTPTLSTILRQDLTNTYILPSLYQANSRTASLCLYSFLPATSDAFKREVSRHFSIFFIMLLELIVNWLSLLDLVFSPKLPPKG